VHSHQGITGQLHHKYAVIDYSEPLSDPTVVTGSHNWSSTAENTNDENTVMVHDARVANLYYQEFRGLLISMGVIDSIEDEEGRFVMVAFPNPSSDVLYLEVSNDYIGTEFTLSDINGRVVEVLKIHSACNTIDVSGLEQGVYVLTTKMLSRSLQVVVQ
jgi:hypothetical protein